MKTIFSKVKLRPGQIVQLFLLVLLSAVGQMLLPSFLAQMISHGVAEGENRIVWMYAVIMAGVTLFSCVISFLSVKIAYTDDKNRTQSAGFIGNLTGKSSVEYVFAAGKVDNKTSEQLYNFIGYAGRAENDGEKQFCYPKRRRSIEYHRRRRTGDLA